MGGFEIILVFIGLVWTIASAVVQNKKKKAALKQRAMMIAAEQGEPDEPVEEEPHFDASVDPTSAPRGTIGSLLQGSLAERFEAIRSMRLEMLQRQNAPASPPVAPGVVPLVGASSIPPMAPAAAPPPGALPSRKTAPRAPQATKKGVADESSMALDGWKQRSISDPVKSKVSEMISSRSSLKAAFVLKELLDPPLALRREGL